MAMVDVDSSSEQADSQSVGTRVGG